MNYDACTTLAVRNPYQVGGTSPATRYPMPPGGKKPPSPNAGTSVTVQGRAVRCEKRPSSSQCSSSSNIDALRPGLSDRCISTRPSPTPDRCEFSSQAQTLFIIGALLGLLAGSQGGSLLQQILAAESGSCGSPCTGPSGWAVGGPTGGAVTAGAGGYGIGGPVSGNSAACPGFGSAGSRAPRTSFTTFWGGGLG